MRRPPRTGLVLALLIALPVASTACPRGSKREDGAAALRKLLDGESAKRYEKKVAEVAAGERSALERAALGYLWLRDGRTLPALVELNAANPRELEKFERKLFYALRGLAYHGEGWYDLAGREFREAGLVSMTIDEVNIEGGNTEPILLADLFASGGLLLATPEEGLATADVSPVQDASVLVGDFRIAELAKATLALRRGDDAAIPGHAEILLRFAGDEAKKPLRKALDAAKGGGSPDWSFLRRPRFVLDLAGDMLGPHLEGTKAHAPGKAAFARAAEIRTKVGAPAGAPGQGE